MSATLRPSQAALRCSGVPTCARSASHADYGYGYESRSARRTLVLVLRSLFWLFALTLGGAYVSAGYYALLLVRSMP